MSDLHDEDFVIWTEQQATLSRRRAAGGLVNDAGLHWRNVAEEIEALGVDTRSAIVDGLVAPDAADAALALVDRSTNHSWPR
jgi:hypothetical protein